MFDQAARLLLERNRDGGRADSGRRARQRQRPAFANRDHHGPAMDHAIPERLHQQLRLPVGAGRRLDRRGDRSLCRRRLGFFTAEERQVADDGDCHLRQTRQRSGLGLAVGSRFLRQIQGNGEQVSQRRQAVLHRTLLEIIAPDMPTFDQKNRLLAITTTLADDTILLTSFSGSEELSKPFVFHLQGVSTNLAIAPADIVGQKITVSVQWQQFDPGSGENTGKVRYFNGYVGRYSAGGLVGADSTRAYQFEMVSWLWFLTLQSGCRIYQAMTVPDIVQQVFSDAGFTDVKNSLQGTYPTLDFCVQYRETHFDFVSRLMEQAGIFYFFQHTDDKHTLVLADDISAYTACPDAKVEFSELYGGSSMGFVNSWGRRYSLIPGKYSHTDYNFETPDTSLVNSTPTVVSLSGLSKYELYDFP